MPFIIEERLEDLMDLADSTIKKIGYQGKFFYHYPMKVNQNREVVMSIVGEGAHLETSSYNDLWLIKRMLEQEKFNPDIRILCSGPKNDAYINLIDDLQHKGVKILEELGYDVDDVFKTFEKSPKQERYNIVGSDDEKVIAPLRRVMMVQNAPDPEWSVSIDVQARHGPDGQQRIAVVIEESRWIKFGKFRAPTRYELAVITPGPFPLREVQMADGMWLEPRLGRSGMDTKEQKTLLEALKNLPRKKARDDVPQFRPDAPVNRPDDFSQNAFKKMDGTKATIPERREPQPRWQKTSQGI
jgi:hypothetical protein